MGQRPVYLGVMVGVWCMRNPRKKTDNASHASVNNVIAKLWMARAAKITELKLNTARIPEHPGTIRLEPQRK